MTKNYQADSSKPNRTAAILGCGKRGDDKVGWAIGHYHAEGWLAADPGIRLIGVDPASENLAAFGQRFQLPPENLFPSTEALYAQLTPDYVSVCTWPALHEPQVLDAARRGVRGIVCEKPMALDPGQIHRMLDACTQAGTRLAIGHQRRHEAQYQLARKFLAEGKIGQTCIFEGRVAYNWDILSWTVHWFDMAAFIMDSAPRRVMAGIDFTGERRYNHPVENGSIVLVEFEGGRQGIFVTGPDAPNGEGITISGSEGMLRIIGEEVHLWNHDGYHVHPAGPSNGFHGLTKEMIAAVETGAPMLCDAAHCHIATEIAYAAQESARTQKAVNLPLGSKFAPLDVLAHPPRLELPGRVVLMADDHFASLGRHGLAAALQNICASEVVEVDAEEGLASEALDGAALVVLYHTHAEASPGTRAALEDWVDAGNPLLLVHCAVGAYPGWETYKQWCGRVWTANSEHPHEPSTLGVTGDSPIPFSWSQASLPQDEVFVKLADTNEVIDAMTATISTGSHPAAWISKRWPNIATWIPGHRGDLWTVPAMSDGLAACIRCISVGDGTQDKNMPNGSVSSVGETSEGRAYVHFHK